MATIFRGNHPKALWPGVYEWFGAVYNQHPEEFPALYSIESSDKAYEEDVMTTGFGLAPVKNEGGSVVYDSHNQQYTTRYTNVAYALGYVVTKEELDDRLYKDKSFERSAFLAFSMRQTKENVAALPYNNCTDTGTLYGDGSALLVTDHPNAVGGTWSNILAVAANLSEASLEDLYIQISTARNPRDLRISLKPINLILPPQLMFEGHRILKSTLQNDTANNADNALRSMGIVPKIDINHYLTSTTAYFMRTNAPAGMKCKNRVGIQFTQDNDFDTENAKAKAYERYTFGCSDPRGVYGTPGV